MSRTTNDNKKLGTYILTLSSHNENDGEIQDFQGIFNSISDIDDFIKAENERAPQDFTLEVIKDPEFRLGLKSILVSKEGQDNGWGGRFYYVWEKVI